jgi:GxxExxY protein
MVTRIWRNLAKVARMTAPSDQSLIEPELTRSIIGAFYAVYNALGFGFLEHVYAAVLEKDLSARGHRVSREVLVPVYYRAELAAYQRLDMLVDDRVIVELKASEKLPPIAERQLYNYLRCTSLEVGLLLHFGHEPKFKRVVHSSAHKHPRIVESRAQLRPVELD